MGTFELARNTKKQPKFSIPVLHDYIDAMFEVFRVSPTVARDFSEMASERGIPFELLVYEVIARGCDKHSQPIPPEMRDYLVQHASQIDPKLRAALLEPEPN
jgi:hypothetical protein